MMMHVAFALRLSVRVILLRYDAILLVTLFILESAFTCLRECIFLTILLACLLL
jgi:hypothetical protein